MCDTVVATGSVTRDGVTLFGKNSDREPNEAHEVVQVAAADHPAGSTVRCTYVDVPQVAHTYSVLLAKPFWIWGAEIGCNEHQVTIGNEAVFTKVPYQKGDGLIGMDLLRLGLERGKTATEALSVITDLLEEHGQGGNCGFAHELYYHNSYILADPAEAWVLETAGPHWAARRIEGVYTISNGLTIENDWDLASDDLVSYAVERGWCKGRDDFSFAGCYSDFLYTRFSDCASRCDRTTRLLNEVAGDVTAETIMDALRDHGRGRESLRPPAKGLTGATVCMHAGFGPARGSQTTGSMVSHLDAEHPTHFVTGTAAPCASIFKPVWTDVPLPDTGPAPEGTYNEQTLFWQHETLHRATLLDYRERISLYQEERLALEGEFVAAGLTCASAQVEERRALSADCFAKAAEAEARWLDHVSNMRVREQPGILYSSAWKKFNRQARMPGLEAS